MKIDDAIKFFEEAAKASARLGTEKLELGAVAHIAYGSYSQIAEWLKELKQRRTIDAVSEWIPCSERLPRPYTEVLVCDECGWISLGSYRPCDVTEKDSGWSTLTRIKIPTDGIIAWMPLPKPYGERKESE